MMAQSGCGSDMNSGRSVAEAAGIESSRIVTVLPIIVVTLLKWRRA